jgi:hypothetical protein
MESILHGSKQCCRVDGITLSNKILWWLPKCSNLCGLVLWCWGKISAGFRWGWTGLNHFLVSCQHPDICQSWMSPLLASNPQESLLQSHRTVITASSLTVFWNVFFQANWERYNSLDCLFVSSSKWRTQISSTVWIQDKQSLHHLQNVANNLDKNGFLLVLCSTVRLPGNHLTHTLEITDDVSNTSFADWKTGYQQFECDMLVLVNDDIRASQHLWANSCNWKTSVRGNTELRFFGFRTHSSSHPVTTGACVDCNTSINNAKMLLDM